MAGNLPDGVRQEDIDRLLDGDELEDEESDEDFDDLLNFVEETQ